MSNQISITHAIIGISIGSVALLIYGILTYKTFKKFNEERRQKEATKTLLIIYVVTILTFIEIMSSYIFRMNMEHIPDNVTNISLIISMGVGTTHAVYSLIFISQEFSVHPKEKQISFIYYLLGVIWGMLIISYFDPDLTKLLITDIVGMIIIGVSGLTITYAAISTIKQKIPLIKASMKYYLVANIIFITILIIAMLGLRNLGTDMMNNFLRIAQIIHGCLYYVAYFKPFWFKKKYAREITYIEKMFNNIKLVNEKKGVNKKWD